MVPCPCKLKALPVNLIGSNVVTPCSILNTTSAESNAVFPGRPRPVEKGNAQDPQEKWRLEEGRQLAKLALGDVSLPTAAKIAHVIPPPLSSNLPSISPGRIADPRSSARILEAGRHGSTVSHGSGA